MFIVLWPPSPLQQQQPATLNVSEDSALLDTYTALLDTHNALLNNHPVTAAACVSLVQRLQVMSPNTHSLEKLLTFPLSYSNSTGLCLFNLLLTPYQEYLLKKETSQPWTATSQSSLHLAVGLSSFDFLTRSTKMIEHLRCIGQVVTVVIYHRLRHNQGPCFHRAAVLCRDYKQAETRMEAFCFVLPFYPRAQNRASINNASINICHEKIKM